MVQPKMVNNHHREYIVATLAVLLISMSVSLVSYNLVYASSTFPTTNPTQSDTSAQTNKNLAEIETQVQTEYAKVYAKELAKKTPDAKARQIAQAAADLKRAELMNADAVKANNSQAAAAEAASNAAESAVFVARSYDGIDWEGSLSIKNPSGQTDIAGLISKLINWLLLILAMVATVVIIISGLMLVFNGGNESMVKTAKSTITWAIIGLVVSLGAFALVNIVQTLL